MKSFSALVFFLSILFTGCTQTPVNDWDVSLIESNFAVPTLDLSRVLEIQTVVDREDGQYLGHPTTVLLDDGKTILTTYPKGHGKGPVVYKKSEDAGQTWSERLPTPTNWETSLEVPTLYRFTKRDGNKRILMFSGLYPIRQAISDDDGETWSGLRAIGEFGGIVAMASMIQQEDGDLVAFFHDDGRFFAPQGTAGTFTVYRTVSSTDGDSWSAPEVVVRQEDMDLCEPGSIWSPDRSELALLLRENSRTSLSQVIFSSDESESWTEPVPLSAELTGDRHTAKYLKDGRLIVVFRDMAPESPTKGDWVAWVGTWDDIVEGRPGSYRIRIMDNLNSWDSTYPGVEILPDGTVVTTTYGHWSEGSEPYIVSVRLDMDMLDLWNKKLN
jgi:hypothetical protein